MPRLEKSRPRTHSTLPTFSKLIYRFRLKPFYHLPSHLGLLPSSVQTRESGAGGRALKAMPLMKFSLLMHFTRTWPYFGDVQIKSFGLRGMVRTLISADAIGGPSESPRPASSMPMRFARIDRIVSSPGLVMKIAFRFFFQPLEPKSPDWRIARMSSRGTPSSLAKSVSRFTPFLTNIRRPLLTFEDSHDF